MKMRININERTLYLICILWTCALIPSILMPESTKIRDLRYEVEYLQSKLEFKKWQDFWVAKRLRNAKATRNVDGIDEENAFLQDRIDWLLHVRKQQENKIAKMRKELADIMSTDSTSNIVKSDDEAISKVKEIIEVEENMKNEETIDFSFDDLLGR